MFGLLLLLGLGLVIYLCVKASNQRSRPNNALTNTSLAQRNYEWAQFIANYRSVATTKAEKDLIERMLADIQARGLSVPAPDKSADYSMSATTSTVAAEAVLVSAPIQPNAEQISVQHGLQPADNEYIQQLSPDWAHANSVKTTSSITLDNASLLLYFGAFLFVASVGLFIGFGGASDVLRTFAVIMTSLSLYFGGMWVFNNKTKQQQAGLAFVGIGMTIAPLAGLAAYYYMFDRTHGNIIWLITSIFCLGMYVHALYVLRRPLVSYILIFTFLSLFESSVSIIHAPIYYFGWGLAFVGLILAFASRLKNFWPEMQEPSTVSSQLLLPVSVLTSCVLVPTQGTAQLAVSFMLAAAYYCLEALNTKDGTRQFNAATAHLLLLCSIGSIAYTFGHAWTAIAVTLFVTNCLQLGMIVLFSKKTSLWRNFASVTMGSAMFGILFGIQRPAIIVVSLMFAVFAGLVVWILQDREEAYVLAILGLMALPIVAGQVLLKPKLNAESQTFLALSALFIQWAIYNLGNRNKASPTWKTIAQQLYIISMVGVLGLSLLAPVWICILAAGLVSASLLGLALIEKDKDWLVAAGLAMAAPLLVTWRVPKAFLASTVLALGLNIYLAVRYRQEANRWFSTLLWLIVPVSLGSGALGQTWSATGYAWAYLAAMIGLVVSRAIARGVILVSSKIPLASYARTASYSYVFGYWSAAIIASYLIIFSQGAKLSRTLILLIITIFTGLISKYIEKRAEGFGLIPLLSQVVLISAFQPKLASGNVTAYLLLSTALACVTYFAITGTYSVKNKQKTAGYYMQYASLIAVFITPFSVLFVHNTLWPMPFGLLIASGLLYYHIRNTSQANRELVGGLGVISVLWGMYFLGVREFQVYSHVTALTCVAYAYWRAIRGESQQSDQYITVALGVATVPLIFQSLGGVGGGKYGWWLLLEQVAFMLIGTAVRKRFVILWGLYVGVAAVLYQLRHLGFAALALLAVFIIGVAMYQFQKHSDK